MFMDWIFSAKADIKSQLHAYRSSSFFPVRSHQEVRISISLSFPSLTHSFNVMPHLCLYEIKVDKSYIGNIPRRSLISTFSLF